MKSDMKIRQIHWLPQLNDQIGNDSKGLEANARQKTWNDPCPGGEWRTILESSWKWQDFEQLGIGRVR